MKIILSIIYFLITLLASQILRDIETFPNLQHHIWAKPLAAIIVSLPLVAQILWVIFLRKNDDEYNRKINDRALATASTFAIMFMWLPTIAHDLSGGKQIQAPNYEIIPSLVLIMFFFTRDLLFKTKLPE